ncbi:MAG: hypothetical protein ABSH28_19830 [Acidobacteriota bacterium]
MAAFVTVDEFGDVEIGGGARGHAGVVAREMLFGLEQVDHFADGELGGLV